jgi:prevent-host-death family protein
MIVTAKDLRFNISMLFDLLSKGEDITVTYRGKPKAKLISYNASDNKEKSDDIFGMLKNETKNVEQVVRNMRQGRKFDI